MTLKYVSRSFQPRLSFPRPFQQSLACFRVARSPSNSWASCFLTFSYWMCNIIGAFTRCRAYLMTSLAMSTPFHGLITLKLISCVKKVIKHKDCIRLNTVFVQMTKKKLLQTDRCSSYCMQQSPPSLPCDAMRCTVFVIVILSVCPSVYLFVCHTRGLCPHGSTYDHDFFTVW